MFYGYKIAQTIDVWFPTAACSQMIVTNLGIMSYTLKVKRVSREAQMKAETSTNGESSNNSSDKTAKQVNSLLLRM